MVFTRDFINAVNEGKLRSVRIMLKDSLLVDKSFRQFDEMRKHAESQGMVLVVENTEMLERAPKKIWNEDLINSELAKLVNGFTQERIDYCKSIIREVYGHKSNYIPKPSPSTPNGMFGRVTRILNSNREEHEVIVKEARQIAKILLNNETSQGERIWTYDDVDDIFDAAHKICSACRKIQDRRN